ncbi:hypothetical protein QQF64_026013 [Cirrhinus molitorella]|uniref:Uncharacterized protein n=1 Tax=Cirrhinus molitorella TaxID=172907 RepID=A0ABR3NS27_9TELE
MGVKGCSLQQAIKSISSVAEKSSNWLWIKRKDPIWAVRAHQGNRGYGMEGGVPGTLGAPLSLLETLWALNQRNVDEAGCPPDDPNDIPYPL